MLALAACARSTAPRDALRAQVTLYGVGKDAVQFHVSHDGKVENGWWHVVNIKVSAAGKVTLEDVEDTEASEH